MISMYDKTWANLENLINMHNYNFHFLCQLHSYFKNAETKHFNEWLFTRLHEIKHSAPLILKILSTQSNLFRDADRTLKMTKMESIATIVNA